jgi:hypothetical protein
MREYKKGRKLPPRGSGKITPQQAIKRVIAQSPRVLEYLKDK